MSFVSRLLDTFGTVAGDVSELYRRIGAADLPTLLTSTVPYPLNAIVRTRTEGFRYRVVATGTGDLTTAGGASLLVLPTDGRYNVKAFGAKGDGVAVDSSAFQAATNRVGNGTLFVPAGTYLVGDVVIAQGLTIECEDANGQTSTNPNGTAAGKVRIQYTGAGGANTFIFRWVAATANQWLFGGGLTGCPVLAGGEICSTGIQASSTARQSFHFESRAFTYAAVRLDSGNSVLSVGCTVVLKFIYGASPAVEGCHGVVLTGETNNAGCTQHDIKTHGLIKNGNMVHVVGNADNNRLYVHASRGGVAGATGNAVAFYDGATTHARNNTILYCAGPIYAAANTYGNHVIYWTSEGSELRGSGQLHIYRFVDYVDGAVYSTPTYPLFERVERAPSEGVQIGSAVMSVLAGGSVGMFLNCPPSVDSGVALNLGIGGRARKGVIRRIRVKYSAASANTAKQFWMRLNVASADIGGAGGFASRATLSTGAAANAAAGVVQVAEFEWGDGSAAVVNPDSVVSVSVERVGSNPSDTAAGGLRIHLIEVDFAAYGPEHSVPAPTKMPDFKFTKA